MMSNKQNPYTFLKNYCLRTPFYSLNFYQNLTSKKDFSLDDLKKYWAENVFRESIFLASPELYSEIEKVVKSNTHSKKNERIFQSVFKYLIRASSRCTPFGLFSQISLNSVEGKKPTTNSFKRRTNFDTNYLFSLSVSLSQIPEIKSQLTFFPNTSLYQTKNGQFRYVEYSIEKNKRSYSIEGIEASEYLNIIISKSEKGKTIDQLTDYLINEEISYEEAKEYVEILIDNQILVSELYPNVTGNDILSELITSLEKLNDIDHIIKELKSLQKSLYQIDQTLGNDRNTYQDIINKLEKINIPFDTKHLFQTDLTSEKDIQTIDVKHLFNIKKVIPLLLKLNDFTKNEQLEKFKKAFIDRYDQQAVSLAEVLDIESGIGYVQSKEVSDTTPFLQDIKPIKKNSSQSEHFLLNEAQEIIYRKLIQSQENKEYTIEITDKDFENIETEWDNIPDTLSAFTEVIHNSDQQKIILHGLSSGAGKLLARFCGVNDEVFEHTRQITDIEQSLNPEKILAEIVHLPQSRTGNILKRPHLRSYEIPYIARSTKPKSNQLSINDLTVSIRNKKIILKSKGLDKEILPRLTNAHYYKSHALPIYHFLCDLEFQNKRAYLGFYWPNIAYRYSFLPRVVYKDLIISKAIWILSDNIIQEFVIKYDNTLKSIEDLKKKYNIPRYIQIKEGDNALLIDTIQHESIKLFINTIKNKKSVILEEFLHLNDNNAIINEKENYANEHIFTFYNDQKLN
ncbi:lantibiotic dehydratase family protein [uncultured Tenacibaculum sp.]|uniref:lantibiotic dehydratase family protein n=1 Tax=uncultured Tenacibaculum sp. TaxID=174713 RepID=UPI00260F061D|nr:lantibiotic dehydratase family protein [uncultured Tenacibaculum sp.]